MKRQYIQLTNLVILFFSIKIRIRVVIFAIRSCPLTQKHRAVSDSKGTRMKDAEGGWWTRTNLNTSIKSYESDFFSISGRG